MNDDPESLDPAPLESLPTSPPTDEDMSDTVNENTPDDLPEKHPLKSKTVWGAILTILSVALSWYLGIDVDLAQYAGRMADGLNLSDLVVVLGAILSIYGRKAAKTKIGNLFGSDGSS